jgi:N-acetylmuramic acid 6-phosphate etherase
VKKSRPDYARLPTEAAHPRAVDLETRSSAEVIALLIAEEARVQRAVAGCSEEIARAVELAVAALRGGGRLVYAGAGTSGRLGALDAAELPPTFGSDPAQVVALVAGGSRALVRSIEGAEDRAQTATRRIARLGIGPRDVVVAIAASGVTPFARAALTAARERGARTVFVTCAPDGAHATLADVVVAAAVGPEVLAGSTRLKAGTATKIILNALSTATMIRLGKVYRGRMVDVVATNQKLKDRARRIVEELAGVDARTAQALLKQANGRAKLALAIHALGVSAAEAERRLAAASGDLHALLDEKPTRRTRPRR